MTPSDDTPWTLLTLEEIREAGLSDSYLGFAFWDSEGYLNTVSMHRGAIELLKPV